MCDESQCTGTCVVSACIDSNSVHIAVLYLQLSGTYTRGAVVLRPLTGAWAPRAPERLACSLPAHPPPPARLSSAMSRRHTVWGTLTLTPDSLEILRNNTDKKPCFDWPHICKRAEHVVGLFLKTINKGRINTYSRIQWESQNCCHHGATGKIISQFYSQACVSLSPCDAVRKQKKIF